MSFGIYVGRNLSRTGHAWLAGYGDEPSSHWLEIVPAADHPKGATVKVGMTSEAKLPGERTELPQVPHTLRHIRVSYSYYLGSPSPLTNGGLNEAGVAVRDIWSPSRPELVALTPPIQRGPNYSDLARLVLERAKSAREGVEIIGQLIAEHGYSCYGGNSHLIADPNEAYVVIEFSGGRGLWVAERLGASSIRISRPGFIGVVPASPNQDFLFPPHFSQTAEEQGWWHPSDGPFDVNRIYGDGKGPWEGARWIDAELRQRAKRPEKIGLEDLIFAIATPKLTGDTAGYGQVVPLVHPSDSALRHLWHAPIGSVTAPLVPVFLGQSQVPAEYGPHRYLTAGESARFLDQRHGPEQTSSVAQSAEARRSAVALFKRLMHLSFLAPPEELQSIHAHWRRMEGRLAGEMPDLLADAAALISAGRREGALCLLTRFSCNALLLALSDAEALAASLDVRLRESGQLNRQEKPKGPQQLW